MTVVLLIANDTNSDFRTITLTTKGIESFLVTVALLVGVAANQLFRPSRVSEVLRYWPSAISECREAASLLMTMNLSVWLIFIPRQILVKGCVPVSSCSSNPVSPPRIHGNFSSNARYNGRWSEKEDQIYFCIFSALMDINRRRPVVYLHLLIPYSFVTVELTSVYTTSCRED